jgi:ubiquinone biosynthesis protein COQ4
MLKQILRPVYALRAFVTLVRDTSALGKVFELREMLQDPAELDRIVAELSTRPEARRALEERPRLGRVDVDALLRLPEGTLGHAFASHLRRAGLDPAAIPALAARTPQEFVPAHLYETHDVWHAVTAFDADVAGELGLQAFYLAQVAGSLPLAILAAGMLNTMLYRADDAQRRMGEIVRGFRLGKAAKPLFGVPWAELWSTPLADVRRSLGLPEDPRAIGLAASLVMSEEAPPAAALEAVSLAA